VLRLFCFTPLAILHHFLVLALSLSV
jgi:hypothetical protein